MLNRRDFLKLSTGALTAPLLFPRSAFGAGGEFLVGGTTPMSGVFAAIGKYSDMGTRLAAADIGTVLGNPVRVVTIDTEGNPGQGVRKVREAIEQKGIRYFTGALLSSEALAIGKEVNKAGGVAFIGAGADEVTGSECNRSTFRWSTTTYGVIEQTVRPLVEMLPAAKRWYTITPQYVFGEALLTNAKNVFKEKGIDHVGNSYHSLTEKEFSGYLSNAMALNADVLLLLNYGAQATDSLRQAASFGMKKKMKILMAYADGVTQFQELGSEVIDGVYLGCQYWHEIDAPANIRFVKRFREEYGVAPPYTAALAYISARLLLEAINRTGSADAAGVIKALEGLKYDGPTGPEEIRAFDHQGVKKYYLLRGKPAASVKGKDDLAEVVHSGESTLPVSRSLCRMS